MRHEIMLRLVVVYRDGQLASKFTTIPLYMILVGAMLVYGPSLSGPSDAFNFLMKMAPLPCWATMIALLPLMRIRALVFGLGSYMSRILVAAGGMLTWMLLVSGSLATANFNPAQMLYTVPLFIEMWLLSRALGEKVTSYA